MTGIKVCLAPTHFLWNASLGGHAWVFLNWALGLQANGAEVTFLERARRATDVDGLVRHVASFRELLSGLGLSARVALMGKDDELTGLAPAYEALDGGLVPLSVAQADSDLLLNFRYGTRQHVVSGFRRTALVDIDPGLLQLWIRSGHVRPAAHDVYFTIGETVGQSGGVVPDCGIQWEYTPPPVFLDAWPVTAVPSTAPLTTVTNWWGEYETIDGRMINNEKRTEFLEYIELPSHASVPLELAIFSAEGRASDASVLESHGWRTRVASEVSATPASYRSYIQQSRGEFSCAKRSCMALQNAWISDRTLCYLASGKPAVVQNTGPSRFLPDHEGLLRFSSLDEAVSKLASMAEDYDHHATSARELVERHFDATRVIAGVLEHGLAVPARADSGEGHGG